jgi:hypothetical protein
MRAVLSWRFSINKKVKGWDRAASYVYMGMESRRFNSTKTMHTLGRIGQNRNIQSNNSLGKMRGVVFPYFSGNGQSRISRTARGSPVEKRQRIGSGALAA